MYSLACTRPLTTGSGYLLEDRGVLILLDDGSVVVVVSDGRVMRFDENGVQVP
jgi:hypothetical protein